MQKIKFLLIILIFLVSINVTSANELESNDTNKPNFENPNTDTDKLNYNDNQNSNNLNTDTTNNEYDKHLKDENTYKTDDISKTTTNNEESGTTSNKFNSSTTKNSIIKDTTNIFIKTTKLKSRDKLIIYLKNSNSIPLINKPLTVNINNKEYSVFTNSEGIATLKLTLTPQNYNINIQFNGDEKLNPQTKNIRIKVSKLSTKISYYANYVVKKRYLYIYLLGKDGEGISGKLKIKLKKRNLVRTSNKNGIIRIKINSKPGKYSIKIKYNGNKYFKASSKKMKFYVTQSSSFYIVNKKLVKNGCLRIYLIGKKRRAISNKRFLIKIGKHRYHTKTNYQGLAIIKVNVPSRTYNIVVKHGKYHIIKKINCINDEVKNPLKNNISLVNGAPDLDYMPANYVNANTRSTYTITRKQYLEVIKRDSYCLFLNNKLSRYVLFRTTSHPHTYHIIKREKWNVIEKEINKKLVSKNKYKYWPKKIKVSLKGKSYKYSEVRDVQNKGYTCGPTSASVCTQVLRNYVPEGYLSKRAHTTKSGTKIQNLENILNKHKFKCTHFYRNSFNTALNELKKGGCAVIFHSQHHYVSIIDISKNGKRVLVSNSYGNYNKIPSKWVSTYYMRHKFGVWDDSLIVRLNYNLNNSTKNSINCFYNSMGKNWNRHNLREKI